VALADDLLAHFQDADGGFFFTANDHEDLIHRPKPLGDESTPAGNGVAAHALLRLGHLLGDTRYLDAAEHTLRLAWPHIDQVPYAHASLLKALDEWMNPTETLVVRAPARELDRWRERMPATIAPRRFALFVPDEEARLPGLLTARSPAAGGVAYLCNGSHCQAPIATPEALGRALGGREHRD
jgi:hypothetical protein